MAATIDTIRSRLSSGDLVYRHANQETVGEGAFLLCSFWLLQCLALQGKLDEAEALFDALCSCANDVGLYPEEVDAISGQFLGNFPQAYTHVGFINAVLQLEKARRTAKDAGIGRS
jgi:GH15 family glucan-1,4-alpha-glucosidase